MFKKPVIVFEGIEGSGKSYHLNNVSKFLKKKKIKHVVIREPGGSKNSEKIRDFILNKNINFHNLTDLFLYLSARNENYNSILKKTFKIDQEIQECIILRGSAVGNIPQTSRNPVQTLLDETSQK